ncbi:MAG: tyrosine--tRNA ligase [Rikenellaceae bacterium]|nr:tyrosine--tRNA ligase [Rikenellaceae bacterium]
MNFVEELTWRGMIQDIMPGTEEQLQKEMTTAYLGIDPTADSLHIGHLVTVMMQKHLQACGYKPIFLIGGATGMIGDPSGKSLERNLLDDATIRHNQEAIKNQLRKIVDFDSDAPNAAEMVNNYDWMKDISFLEFIRDVGKLITVNYMMAKDSVKKRFSGDGEGMSFTEFTYQLVQGYDFMHLYEKKGCRLQVGGSDQWGNITTGTELIRRKLQGEAYGIVCPLIKKSDGIKFGKTEQGNVWLDPVRTSPYRFYQFWVNVSDEDAERYIKIFTMLDKDTIDKLTAQHREAPHARILQKELAKQITTMIHSEQEYNHAVEASMILFGSGTAEALKHLDQATFLDVFDGVPQFEISRDQLRPGIPFGTLCTETTAVFSSKGELRRLIQGGGISLNKVKVKHMDEPVDLSALIADRFLLVQKGKKNYYLIVVN